jgi:hypothetical protein
VTQLRLPSTHLSVFGGATLFTLGASALYVKLGLGNWIHRINYSKEHKIGPLMYLRTLFAALFATAATVGLGTCTALCTGQLVGRLTDKTSEKQFLIATAVFSAILVPGALWKSESSSRR